jgi:hypothetical protein
LNPATGSTENPSNNWMHREGKVTIRSKSSAKMARPFGLAHWLLKFWPFSKISRCAVNVFYSEVMVQIRRLLLIAPTAIPPNPVPVITPFSRPIKIWVRVGVPLAAGIEAIAIFAFLVSTASEPEFRKKIAFKSPKG